MLRADAAPDRLLELRRDRLAGGAGENEAHELGVAILVRPARTWRLFSAHPQQRAHSVGRVIEMSIAGAQVVKEFSVRARVGESGAHRQELPESDSLEGRIPIELGEIRSHRIVQTSDRALSDSNAE